MLLDKLKGKSEKEPVFLERETREVAQLSSESYRWLGPRYAWYNKIRTADKNALHLLGGKHLEEQMEATRSALTLVTKTLNANLILAYNSTLTALEKADPVPENLPAKIDMENRSNPPNVSGAQDALILSYMPLRFLNLAKALRDKGQGIDHYAEGLVKKMFFKVIAFYCDPANWDVERLAYFINDLPEEADLATINTRLSPLKTELELFAGNYLMFKFGQPPVVPGQKNLGEAVEDVGPLTPKEMVRDLYMQSFIIQGIDAFLFRYYLTLLSRMKNPRGFRVLSSIFAPVLAKSEEIKVRFQASWAIERDKTRLRDLFQEFYKEEEAKPPTKVVKGKKGNEKRINYTQHLQVHTSFHRASRLNEKQTKIWQSFLMAQVSGNFTQPRSKHMLLEIMAMLVRTEQFVLDGKLTVVNLLRNYADGQEKMGLKQVADKKRIVSETARKKKLSAIKFKTMKQFDMVKTIEDEAIEIQTKGDADVERLAQAVEQRKEAMMARSEKLETTAQEEGANNLGHTAASIFKVADQAKPEEAIRPLFLQFLLKHIQEENDSGYHQYYKNLYSAIPGLYPTEKIVLRKALATRIELGDNDMVVTEEELHAYQEQITTLKTDIAMAFPGLLDQRLREGAVNTTLNRILEIGIEPKSLRLILSLPVNEPNKPPAKIPQPAVAQMMKLNQLMHPFAEIDLILENVAENTPAAKKLNLNRLSKAT